MLCQTFFNATLETYMAKPTITICSSANFYRQAVDIQARLEAMGFRTILPEAAEAMKKSGNFDVVSLRSWLNDAKDYHIKTRLMRGHFDRVAEGDVVLVLNYEKHGAQNYIGGNVLMEMALAFHLKQPIYILNEIPDTSLFLEEIIAMEPIVLQGKLERLASLKAGR
jgi:hypothetical protein